jgi:hypothetical protein
MKLEDQVCSLDLAKRLYDIFSVNQKDVAFYWIEDRRKQARADGTYKPRLICSKEARRILSSKVYSWAAFTVAELGEMLPAKHIPKKYEVASGVGYRWGNSHPRNGDSSIKEADARAKMLIYLLENKLI